MTNHDTGATVPHLDETLLQMTLSYDDLLAAASVHAGRLAPGDAPTELRRAGIVGTAGLHPAAAGLVEVAVAPARSVVLERFDGKAVVPLFVGWLPDGRAATSTPNADRDVVVTATDAELLRDQLRQWLSVFDREVPADRDEIVTDTEVLDRAMASEAPEDVDGGLGAVLAEWRLVWRANANWAEAPIDARVTIVDAGGQGFYRVEHPERAGGETVPVTLVPVSTDEVIALLGDVVTGRDRAAADHA